MIVIEKTETYGWEAAVRGMRNPKNSWDKSDSFQCDGVGCLYEQCPAFEQEAEGCKRDGQYIVGMNDLGLMKALAAAGNDHGKFLRMITVTVDLTAPLYWWKEFDTYKVGTVADSCSTMHKIHAKKFTLEDFSCEHLVDSSLCNLEETIEKLNFWRQNFIIQSNKETYDMTFLPAKTCWWQMIQLLPSSYNQKRTVQMNYAVLKNMYHARKNHKLDEWHTLCDWIKGLPYSELITG